MLPCILWTHATNTSVALSVPKSSFTLFPLGDGESTMDEGGETALTQQGCTSSAPSCASIAIGLLDRSGQADTVLSSKMVRYSIGNVLEMITQPTRHLVIRTLPYSVAMGTCWRYLQNLDVTGSLRDFTSQPSAFFTPTSIMHRSPNLAFVMPTISRSTLPSNFLH